MWRSCCQNMAQSKWMRPRLRKTTTARTMRRPSPAMPLRLFMGLVSCAAVRLVCGGGEGCRGGALAAIEFADAAGDVGAGLGVGRNAVVAVDCSGAGVVGGDGEGDVVVVAGEQLVEVGGAAGDV